MTIRPDWEIAIAVARLPIEPWIGKAWRYHRAADRFPPDQTWPALYLGLSYGVCMAETMRHLPKDAPFSMLTTFYLSEIEVSLRALIDCRDVTVLGIALGDLLRDRDYDAGQQLAAAVRARGCDGLLVPSATLLPDAALIVFPDVIQPNALRLVRSMAPRIEGL